MLGKGAETRARRLSCRLVYLLVLMLSVLGSGKLGGEQDNSWCEGNRESRGGAGILESKGIGCVNNG